MFNFTVQNSMLKKIAHEPSSKIGNMEHKVPVNDLPAIREPPKGRFAPYENRVSVNNKGYSRLAQRIRVLDIATDAQKQFMEQMTTCVIHMARSWYSSWNARKR